MKKVMTLARVAAGKGAFSLIVAIALLAQTASPYAAFAQQPLSNDIQAQVTVCHLKGNGEYVKIVIDDDGLHGHDHHDGDIINPQGGECPGQPTPQPCLENIVVNGSFEEPNIGSNWDIVDSGSADIGWLADWSNVNPGQPDPATIELHHGVAGWNSQSGDQHTELDSDWGGPSSGQSGEDASIKLYQNLVTVPGNTYHVEFYLSPRPGLVDNKVRVTWDGTEVVEATLDGSANGNTVWGLYSYDLVATDSSTELAFEETGTGNSLGMFLDNVSVVGDCESTVRICKTNELQQPLADWELQLLPDFNEQEVKVAQDIVEPTYSDVSGEDGCVTFSHVPYGDYTTNEIVKPGWENVSGNGTSVEVNDPEETFYIVNRPICLTSSSYAVDYQDFNQALRKNGTAVLAARSIPSKALGAPQNNDTENFVSLGFGGSIVLTFGGAIDNIAGPDIKVTETSYGAPSDSNYPEKVEAAASQDGVTWTVLGSGFQDEEFDLGALPWANYLKLTDISDSSSSKFPSDADGYDVDAVQVYARTCLSTVSGQKFNDLNGNGVKDPGEQGLAGWTIYAYDTTNGLASNITVDSTDTDGSDTNWVAPGEYLITARGTWNNRIGSGDQEKFDAEFYTQNNWGSHTDGTTPGDYTGAGANEGDLMLNNTFPNWGPYNDLDYLDFEHYYYLPYTHGGGNINFSIFDGDVDTGVKNPGWYSDNSGSLNVYMYRLSATAITDANGNYELTFETIPGSTVTVGEIQQDGWIQTFPTAPGTHTFVAENGSNEITDKDFGNHQDNSCDPVREQDALSRDAEDYNPCISTISGTKYHDLDGDGIKGEDEPGLEGWEMYAYNGIPSSNITVNSANLAGSNTNDVAAGQYVIMARGTWHNGGGSHYFDSEFHTTDSWTTHEDGEVGTGPDNGDLVINDNFVNWSVYNDQNENGFEHYYFLIYNHPGGNINYSVFDGELGVKNPGWYGDNDGSINVQMYKLLDTAVTDANGDYTLDINTTDPVTVVVREIQQNGWVQTSPNASTDVYALNGLIEGANYPITGNWNVIFETGIREVSGKDFGNRHQGINVKADKIVCDAEQYLPNWGAGGNGNPGLITADTAQNFVNASNGHCAFQTGWSFQWGHNDKDSDDETIEGVDMTTGDHTGPADSDGDSTGLCGDPYCGDNTETGTEYDEWQGFDTTTSSNVIIPYISEVEIPTPTYMPAMLTIDDLNGSDRIWVREELQKGFVPFSAPEDEFPGSDVSAEIYCHDDIANYDNYDYILNPTAGNTYYCVAFNAPEPENNDLVTGQKWHDYNGNGDQDLYEDGIEGWTIYAAEKITSVGVNAQDAPFTPIDKDLLDEGDKYLLHVEGTFTAGDGIEADAKFSERNSSGTWTDLVQSYESYGPELLDLQLSNDNGSTYDSFLTDPYDTGHSYWHEFTYTSNEDMLFKINDIFPSNNTGSLNVTLYKVIASTQTDGDGNYSFDLSEADGEVIIMEEHQFNWEQTFPQANGEDEDFYTIDASGIIQNGENLDFGNRLLCSRRMVETKVANDEYGEQNPGCNTISGYKWNDLNGNHEWDDYYDEEGESYDEPALGGVRIYLDLNNNNSYDDGEPYDITDENGYYAFYNLPTGQYTVREVVPSNYIQTYPSNDGDDEYVVTVNNNNFYNNDFGNQQTCFEVEVDQILTFRDTLNTSENCISLVDPAVVKTVDNSSPAHGATIVYTITVTNNSVDTTATGIEITDAIPSGVTYVSDDGLGAYNSGTHIWTIPSLDSGASITLHITATVDGNASGTITNTATVTDSDLGDSDYSNNTDSADITVQTSGGGGSVTTQGGGGGCVGASCFGDRTPGNPGSTDGGEVLGDFTDTPSITAPQVLGTTTSLPRTGSSLAQLIAALGLSVLPLLFGKKRQEA